MEIDALFDRAVAVARLSPNPRRKVGAVLVPASGEAPIAACNAFPPGIRPLPERADGENRFVYLEHAERGALFEAARRGIATAGATLLSTCFPCADCARAIILSGVETLQTPPPRADDPVWGASFRASAVLLEEGGVEVRFLDADQDAVHDRILAG